MATSTFVFTRTNSSIFVADNIRNQLRDLVKAAGLDPTQLVDDWGVIGGAAKRWMETGHLYGVTIEFFYRGSERVQLRWDFDISYGGSGVDDDMWVDRDHLRRTIEKAGRPPAGCEYRVLLSAHAGRPEMPGMATVSFKSTDGLVSRSTGTSIATQDVMAGLRYWRAA
jgi:hypothetical protein